MNEMDSNSYRTAISRKTPSKPLEWLGHNTFILEYDGKEVLDYGSGRGMDAYYLGADQYDPHYYPKPPPPGTYRCVLCTYVLNTISPEAELEVLKGIKYCLVETGMAYITVRRDVPITGTKTQRFVTLPEDFFIELHTNSNFTIYLTYRRLITKYLESKEVKL